MITISKELPSFSLHHIELSTFKEKCFWHYEHLTKVLCLGSSMSKQILFVQNGLTKESTNDKLWLSTQKQIPTFSLCGQVEVCSTRELKEEYFKDKAWIR